MITVRSDGERGHSDFGWLDSHHTFSFGEYYDPRAMGYRKLRVINDDRVAGGRGFGTHPHRDMEILSYVLEGALEHKDSMGTGSVIKPGDVQRMTAGTGVLHSEKNGSTNEKVHFLQIWIEPEKQGLKPSYEQKSFPLDAKRGGLTLVASRDGREGSITIHQDVSLYAGRFANAEEAKLALSKERHTWVQVARGSVSINGKDLIEGDGAAIEDESALHLVAKSAAEVLVFDLG